MDTLIIFAASDGIIARLGDTAQTLGERFGFDAPFFVAQIVNFLIVALILYFFAFRPVLKIIDERQRKINDGLQYAEEMKAKLAETEKKYNEIIKQGNQEAQQALDEAREHAKHLMEKQTKEAISRAEDLIANARSAAALEHEKMLQNVRTEVIELVVATTSKVLKKELSEQEREQYAQAASKEVVSRN